MSTLSVKSQEILATLIGMSDRGELRGTLPGIPNEVYHHTSCPGISSSKLALVSDSIQKYRYYLNNPRQESFFDVGSALHDSILLPDIFNSSYVRSEKFDRRTKAGKEASEIFQAQHQGKTILDEADYDRVLAMRDSIFSNSTCRFVFKDGSPELSHWWTDQESEVLCKCRTDWIIPEKNIVVDIKTTSKGCSKHDFSWTIAKLGYDRSAAFYLSGLQELYGVPFNFCYVVVETQPPYEVGLYVLGKKSIQTGQELYKRAIQKYKEYSSMTLEQKASYEQKEFQVIEMPEWAHYPDAR